MQLEATEEAVKQTTFKGKIKIAKTSQLTA